MNERSFQEDLSISYLRAIAAQAQVDFNLLTRDTGSKDVLLSKYLLSKDEQILESTIFIQLKATYSHNKYKIVGDYISYSLKVKNYNELCGKNVNPKFLALLIMPEEKNDWVTQSVDQLIIRNCMYWISLKDKTKSNNTSDVTITIPKENILTPDTLIKILQTGLDGDSL